MDVLVEYGPAGLFVAAFLAATILPLGSEAILSALLATGLEPWPLVLVASLGNTLGSLCNYLLGYYLVQRFGQRPKQGRIQAWMGLSQQRLEQARMHFSRYGMPSLCFAWLPVVGDPLTFIAGILRVNVLAFIVLVAIGKFGRYCAVAAYWL